MKLTASVGRMAANKREDVSLVQEAFGQIKVQTKFGRKPLWPKRPDGRNSRDLEGAIACFQDLSGLKPTGKLDAYGPGLSKLKMAVPAAFRNARGVRGTAATVSGPANPAQLALREAGKVKTSAPFPTRERTALADGILRSGREAGICLSRKRDWITNDGRFATELQIDGTLAAATAERSGVIRQISRLICLGAAWQNSTVSSLVFTSKRQLTALKGLGKSLARAERDILGLTAEPSGPVLTALAKGCAALLTSGRIATPDGKAEHQIIVSAAESANAPLAKMLAAAGAAIPKHSMADVARFIHGEMIANVGSGTAREIRDLNRRFADPNTPSFPAMQTGPAGIALGELKLGIEDKINAYVLWAAKVAGGRDWDFKDEIKNRRFKQEWFLDIAAGLLFNFDIWSNIHYGYVGKGIGFGRLELTSAAGIAQVLDNPIPSEAKRRFGSALMAFGSDILAQLDDPPDRAAVELGIDLWDSNGTGLDFDTFLKEIRLVATTLHIKSRD